MIGTGNISAKLRGASHRVTTKGKEIGREESGMWQPEWKGLF